MSETTSTPSGQAPEPDNQPVAPAWPDWWWAQAPAVADRGPARAGAGEPALPTSATTPLPEVVPAAEAYPLVTGAAPVVYPAPGYAYTAGMPAPAQHPGPWSAWQPTDPGTAGPPAAPGYGPDAGQGYGAPAGYGPTLPYGAVPPFGPTPPYAVVGATGEPAAARARTRGKGVAGIAALLALGLAVGAGAGYALWHPGAGVLSNAAAGAPAGGGNAGGTSPQGGSGSQGGTGSQGGSGGQGGNGSDPFPGFGGLPGLGGGSGDGSGSGSGSGSGDGSGNGSSTTSGSTLNAAEKAAVAAVSPAIVDINTVLGYRGGKAAGTGIVLSSNGEVLTNNHVISGATSITATDVGNGKTYTAKVVGYDASHDIALIQLQNASGLATASLGDSTKVTVGQDVVGVGNAGGVGGTPSAAGGTVSALGQSITAQDAADGTSEQLSGLIQVDANIQAGDSGGPLVDTSGHVVGVDAAGSVSTFSSSQGTQGFAVPINTALQVASQIVGGHASATVHLGQTAFLGVQIASSRFGATGGGAQVGGVVSGTPAANAGLAAGDTITAIDGQQVGSPEALSRIMAGHHPGDKVTVHWTDANGASHSATVTLANGPAA